MILRFWLPNMWKTRGQNINNNIKREVLSNASLYFFGLLPHRSQPSGWTIQLHRGKRYLRWGLFLAQIVAIMLGCFVFIPYSCYMVGFLYLYLRRFKPFPCFLLQEQRWWSFREDRETALMRCLHHLRAASGEWSNLHVGLVATTPLFEEETYRKVCRMGRDDSFSAKMDHAHLHQGAILGHPAWHVLMALFLQVSSSLAPMQVYWRMSHCPAAKLRVATGLRERGLLSTAHVQCGKNGVFDRGLSCLVISIYIYCYYVI